MSSYIPPEIITDILIRLPVKSLLRFRCVSKLWLSIIDTKHFTKLHLRHSYSTSSNRTLVVDSVELFYIDLDAFERLDVGVNKFRPQSVVCSCDGLVLISFQFGNLALWNPATRKFNRLPVASLDDGNRNKVIYAGECYALGYDSKNDDYKVVKVIRAKTKLDGQYVPYGTKVFSLKSYTWKRIKDFPYTLASCKRWGAYLNDTLHTVVNDSSRNCKVIMGFNIATEEHIELPKPGINIALASVEVMGGCLTAIAPGESEWSLSEIWVMKEYGVKSSWTMLFSILSPSPLGNRCLNLVPLAYSKSGDKVLLNYAGICLKWCSLRNQTFSLACVPGLTASFNASTHDPSFHAEFCVGSLVSPHSPAGTQYDRQKLKGKEIEKQSADFLSFRFKQVL